MALMCVRHLEYRQALQGSRLSLQQIRNVLLRVEYTVFRYFEAELCYAVPMRIYNHAKSLYNTMGLTWNESSLDLG